MGLARAALGLGVLDFLALGAQLGHDAADEGRRVLQVAQRLDKALVVQAKAGELLDLLAAAHLLDELVVAAAQPVHDRVFLALGLAANDDFVALFPLGHKPGDHLHRVLEVGAHRDRAVAGGVDHAVVRAVELTEVLDVEDGPDVLVLGADLPDDGTGAVLALIVDEQNLIVVVRAALDQLIAHSLIDGAGVLLLVVAGDHYRNRLFLTHFVSFLTHSMVSRIPSSNGVAGRQPVSSCKADVSACRCMTCSGP